MSTATDVRPEAPEAVRAPQLRRWARRLAIALAALWAVVTLLSFGFNAVTAGTAEPPPGQTYVQAGDVKTRYRSWGTTGSPIVLVHGSFESADTWARLAPHLARGHRVYAFDLTGSGYSTRKGPYTTGHMAEQTLGFLDAMKLGGPGQRPVLVAHSSGAAVAAEAALRAPDRVGGLMMLDGDALDTGPGAEGPPPGLLVNPYRTSLLRIARGSDWLIRSAYNSQCGPTCPRLDAAGVREWRRPYEVKGAEKGLWDAYGDGSPGLAASRVAMLRATGIPASVVFGAEDDVFTKTAPAETAARIGAPAPTLIPGSRHLPMISNPAAVAQATEALATRARR
ncbi:alpha/beta fold hydrolase [Spirillospora sp. CA-294931]|uniref:alpha/beta fold hydrolase n=1 Tax=Spirillospora sp. CA-294931 TaxID=3240042 RepID=UPI003D8CA5FE